VGLVLPELPSKGAEGRRSDGEMQGLGEEMGTMQPA